VSIIDFGSLQLKATDRPEYDQALSADFITNGGKQAGQVGIIQASAKLLQVKASGVSERGLESKDLGSERR
jgi:hypothetical protein